MSGDRDRGKPPPDEEPLRREDLERALRFVHALEAQTKARVEELAATVNAALEALVGEGALPLERYEKRRRLTVLRENERSRGELGLEVSDVADKYAMGPLPAIDCAARLPLCRARCCTFRFALSVQDLDERIVRWDYARPYRILRRDDGYCTHHDGGGCGVYDARPAACRAYDCRSDRRIWLDFEARIPAPLDAPDREENR